MASLGALVPLPASAQAAPPAPFASWGRFIDRQYWDVLASAPTAQQRADTQDALASGTTSPGQVIAELRATPDQRTVVDPTVRLYRAFFLRPPDPSGLGYWSAARRTGGWTLVRMAATFAGSSEFTARYGALSDRAFIELIYDNVLERPPDEGGVDFWTRQLTEGRRTRGSVMVGFSESAEHRAAQANEVTASTLAVFLLGRAPTADEQAAWVGQLDGGATVADLAAEVLSLPEYVTRAARTRVVVFGDSVPDTLIRNGRPGADLSSYELVDAALGGCDGADHPPPARSRDGTILAITATCATGWKALYPPALVLRPERAVVLVGQHAMLDHKIAGTWQHPCRSAARSWYRSDLTARLTYLATKADHVVLVLPAWPGPNSGWVMPSDYVTRADCVRQEMAKAAAATSTATVDLGTHLCPTSPTRCSPTRNVDGIHIDPEDAASVLTWLLDGSAPAA